MLCTAYKIYADILRAKLEEEVERKNVISHSQSGFRKGRGTMDNIFILNHIIQRDKEKEDSKVYALFVDLKAAVDSINREEL